ncbi:uncharacterized protein EV422DRAFT_228476 [Fimicolochytrium jonesii]|uniref:uncharacterized protein n=1 Tax=Fimicolochytrium jonesii TaxID=1396493 RepID=UPI0022FE0649|nr:uncharacterized protein EV422DRAFT_228476 [Fimicolochytrium jonesii]KAI8817241.1 hypothetical protein EV422DRAFT_228476 [Fimicolochytrium jonesii]
MRPLIIRTVHRRVIRATKQSMRANAAKKEATKYRTHNRSHPSYLPQLHKKPPTPRDSSAMGDDQGNATLHLQSHDCRKLIHQRPPFNDLVLEDDVRGDVRGLSRRRMGAFEKDLDRNPKATCRCRLNNPQRIACFDEICSRRRDAVFTRKGLLSPLNEQITPVTASGTRANRASEMRLDLLFGMTTPTRKVEEFNCKEPFLHLAFDAGRHLNVLYLPLESVMACKNRHDLFPPVPM